MPTRDRNLHRLFNEASLVPGESVAPDRAQANYLLNVLRMRQGGQVLLFNGRDGEWLADVVSQGRKNATLYPVEQTRPQTHPADLEFLFAPLKQARMDYMVQKAVEMGAGVLRPVLTEFTQLRKVNLEKMRSYSVEAAEQCGILNLPDIREPQLLETVLEDFDPAQKLVFCDEVGESAGLVSQLEPLRGERLAVLIGPEGGFSDNERALLKLQKFVVPISLGPRILRADTAAVAALAAIQAIAGDWLAQC